MAKCKNCGKKGFFLKLNEKGLCQECAEIKKSGHSDEENACKYLISELENKGFEHDKFKIEHRSQEYTSLFYALEDIARIKITDNVRWISIPLREEDRNNPDITGMFEESTLKLRHCKSYMNSLDDLSKYVEFISILTPAEYYGISRKITEKEKEYLKYTYDYMVSLGADPECFYLYVLTNEIELIYKSWHCAIRYRLYKKKPGGKISYPRIENSKCDEMITQLADLEQYKSDIIKNIEYADNDPFNYDMSGHIKYTGSNDL